MLCLNQISSFYFSSIFGSPQFKMFCELWWVGGVSGTRGIRLKMWSVYFTRKNNAELNNTGKSCMKSGKEWEFFGVKTYSYEEFDTFCFMRRRHSHSKRPGNRFRWQIELGCPKHVSSSNTSPPKMLWAQCHVSRDHQNDVNIFPNDLKSTAVFYLIKISELGQIISFVIKKVFTFCKTLFTLLD